LGSGFGGFMIGSRGFVGDVPGCGGRAPGW
jgi:hypothetical protein